MAVHKYRRSIRISSGYQLVLQQQNCRRPSLKGLERDVFPCGGPSANNLVEISGPSDSGKSQLLWHLMVCAVSPIELCGKAADVIFIDLGHKFDGGQFTKQLERIISESFEHAEGTAVLRRCEESVSILQCFSGEEFDNALTSLEKILWENHKVSLLAIDELDAFYWLDMQSQVLQMSAHYTKILEKLRRICRYHNLCCVYTVQANYITQKTPYAPTQAKIDYRLKLDTVPETNELTLNGKRISIDANGMHFPE